MRKHLFYLCIAVMLFVLPLGGCKPAAMVNLDDISYPPITFSLPEAERIDLPNGIILYLLEDHELPFVNISAVIRTGSIYDPVGKEGVAEITGIVMRTGGTKGMTGDEIDSELDYMAGRISVSAGKESGTATMSVLKKDIEKGLSIFSDILINPVFEEKKLKLAKELKTEALRRIYDNPQKLAFREFVRLIYQGNPRGRMSSIKSIEVIGRNDLVRFHKRFFYPGNIMMAVTGDISKEEAVSKINKYFGTWKTSGKVEKISIPRKKDKGSVNYLFKEIPQSIVIFGQFAPGKKDSDYYSFEVLDFILGSGGFRSRIFSEVRNNLGLAYSAGSFYSPRSEYGAFGAYAMTKTSSTVKSLSAIRAILKDAGKIKVTDEELKWSKKSINNNFIFAFSSAEQIARQQMMLEYNDLPEGFLVTYRDKVNKVSSEDLQRVAVKYLSDKGEVIFVLGNEKGFDKPLSSFGKVNKIVKGEE